MNNSAQNNFTGSEFIEQAVRIFSYFDLILTQLKAESKESFSHSLFLFKKISENIKSENVLIANEYGNTPNDLFSKDFELCRAKLNEIIVLLQFEDILNQKFDHISQIDHIVIDVLQNTKELTTANKLLLLKKIILLNSAQLEYAKDEYETIFKDLKNKLEEIYKASESILSIIPKSEKENIRYSGFTISVNSSMKLIRSFIDMDAVKFSSKIDALIKIFEGLDINTVSPVGKQSEEFDLNQLLKIYTIESERIVFKKVLAGDEVKFSNETTASSTDMESVHLF
jgi:hypothetical protein